MSLFKNYVDTKQPTGLSSFRITLCNTKKNSKTKRVDFGIFGGAEHEYEIYFFLSRQVFSAFYMLI